MKKSPINARKSQYGTTMTNFKKNPLSNPATRKSNYDAQDSFNLTVPISIESISPDCV